MWQRRTIPIRPGLLHLSVLLSDRSSAARETILPLQDLRVLPVRQDNTDVPPDSPVSMAVLPASRANTAVRQADSKAASMAVRQASPVSLVVPPDNRANTAVRQADSKADNTDGLQASPVSMVVRQADSKVLVPRADSVTGRAE